MTDMLRKVFFSFHYDRDVVRVSQVRNSNVVKSKTQPTKFLDHANWETIKRSGSTSVKRWIDDQLTGATVTCVLIGRQTNERDWVHYEIEQSILRKHAILGIYIHNVKNFQGVTDLPGFNPFTKHKIGGQDLDMIAPTFDWVLGNGYVNFGDWIENSVNRFTQLGHFRG